MSGEGRVLGWQEAWWWGEHVLSCGATGVRERGLWK